MWLRIEWMSVVFAFSSRKLCNFSFKDISRGQVTECKLIALHSQKSGQRMDKLLDTL